MDAAIESEKARRVNLKCAMSLEILPIKRTFASPSEIKNPPLGKVMGIFRVIFSFSHPT
jgi:hypothetical protein